MIQLQGLFMAPEGKHAGGSKKQALESHQEPRMCSVALVFVFFSLHTGLL